MRVAVVGTVARSIFGFRLPFIKQLIKNGAVVYAFALDFTEEQKRDLIELGVQPVDYSMSRSSLNPIAAYRSIKELTELLKKFKIEIYFGYFLKPVLFGGLAAYFAKVPTKVGMIEGLGQLFTDAENGPTLKQKLLREVFRLQFKFVAPRLDKLIVLNKEDKAVLQGFSSKANIKVLGGIGVDLNEYSYVPIRKVDPIRFIFVGRLLKEKGINYFLHAAEIVKKEFINAEFHILGAADLAAKNEVDTSLLKRLTKNNIVIHFGYVDNVRECLENSSVFVLPSYYREGVPRSSQEAMAIGRAVITTNSVGCKDTVIDEYNGYLVSKFDSVDLANKMKNFLLNPELVAQMGVNGRKLAEERFNVDIVNNRLIGYVYD